MLTCIYFCIDGCSRIRFRIEFDQFHLNLKLRKLETLCYIYLALWAEFPTSNLLFFTRLVSHSHRGPFLIHQLVTPLPCPC
jgi:hypothetical protein